MNQTKDVILQKHGHTALMTLNKPKKFNALNIDFMRQINHCLDVVAANNDIYILIITGTGKSFIAGADIQEMYSKDSEAIYRWSAAGSNLNLKIEAMEIPVIAAINGYALGGGLELSLACDIRLASENARLGLPETSLGVICAAGGTQRLPRIIGTSRAKELIFTAEQLSPPQALSIGLIDRICSHDSLLEEAFALSEKIERNGPLAVKAAKKAVKASCSMSIEEGCMYERKLFSRLFETEDQKMGMAGFLHKEKNVKFNNR